MEYTQWSMGVMQPFFFQLFSFLSEIILALIVFIIGYLIAIGIGRIVAEILKSLKFNKLFEKESWKKALHRANVEVNPSEFIGAIFKWVFVIVALLVAVDILNLQAFAGLLTQVINYLPNVIVAVLVFVVAIIASDIVGKIVRATVERLKVGSGYIASSIVNWAIWIFTILLILDLVLPSSLMIKTFYTAIVYGVVGALALGAGLAIGLGGKETAGKIISDMYQKSKE